MGIFDWFKKSGNEQAVQPTADDLVFAAGKEELSGLNFKTAIDAHMKWRLRLTAVIDGTSAEKLDPDVVGRDDQCVLGKWIYSDGGKRYSDSLLFQELREEHARFHKGAGDVLRAAQSGDMELARALLTTGDFASASRRVTRNLAKLYGRYSEE
ncbi:MAG: CZB domain-containing protein [Nitrosomonadales bacterium]|nr:CZB domain-containing protein [Nitrosomonadales bacterium]